MPSPYEKPLSLCWFCKKATCSGCSWSDRFEPVRGWEAIPMMINQYSGAHHKTISKVILSYHVVSCPDFKEG